MLVKTLHTSNLPEHVISSYILFSTGSKSDLTGCGDLPAGRPNPAAIMLLPPRWLCGRVQHQLWIVETRYVPQAFRSTYSVKKEKTLV